MLYDFDVAVAGLGPAGRALAHRLTSVGLRVLGVDPNPQRSWPQTLAGWRRQLPAWLPADVAAVTLTHPVIHAVAEYRIHDEYAVLDNAALQRATPLAGMTLEERLLDDDDVMALRARARVVVDARGARPAGEPRTGPYQSAHGVILPPAVASNVLGDVQAVLMDWRPFDGAERWGRTPATFLYVVPLSGERVLLEETCLAGEPGPDQEVLRHRLHERLRRFGVSHTDFEDAEVERVSIPLVRRGRHVPGVVRFGAAGAQNNPISGYTCFASLAAVDDTVARIRRHEPILSDGPSFVRRRALHGLLNLAPDDTFALFDAFARLSTGEQRAVLDVDTPRREVVAAMRQQFRLMPRKRAWGLARATLLP